MFTLTTLISSFIAIAHIAHAVPYNPGLISPLWTTQDACAVDIPSRVLTGVVTTVYSDNTAGTCIERCDAQNFIYAGVENGNECHCGTGLAGTPQIAPRSDCNFTCTGESFLTGESNLSCGGGWRIQIYKKL